MLATTVTMLQQVRAPTSPMSPMRREVVTGQKRMRVAMVVPRTVMVTKRVRTKVRMAAPARA